jgi:hypothetical protein
MILRLGTWGGLKKTCNHSSIISKQNIIHRGCAGSSISLSAKQRFNLSGFESRVGPGIGPVFSIGSTLWHLKMDDPLVIRQFAMENA